MTLTEAEKITADFGIFFANRRGSLAVLENGTTADGYEGVPYFSVWDLPYSPARIKYAILFRAEYAFTHGYMDFIPPYDDRENDAENIKNPPIGNILYNGYKLLSFFVENAYEINKERLAIDSIEDAQRQRVAIIKFEAKYKVDFRLPDDDILGVEFQNFLADLQSTWQL